MTSLQFSSVQFSRSITQLSPILCHPMDCSTPGFPVHHQLLEFTQTHAIELVMPSNHLVLCCPRVLLPSIFHIIRVFSSELAVCIRWPMYWSFSFSISPCNEYSGIKHLRVSAQKGSEGWLHVARILQAGSAQCQEGNSTRKSFFCQLVRVGCVIGFQSLLGHCMKGQLWFHPTQRLAKLRCLETPRNRKEGQG